MILQKTFMWWPLLILLPSLFYYMAKKRTISENKHIKNLKLAIEQEQNNRIWKAFDTTGIIPLPHNIGFEYKIPVFLDKKTKSIFAFHFEDLIYNRKTKIPKTYDLLIKAFAESEQSKKGWRLCKQEIDEDFYERLAELDDLLDFNVINEDIVLKNKASFNLKMLCVGNNSKAFVRSLDLNDGKISLNEENKNSLGSLSAVISSKEFCKIYDINKDFKVSGRQVKWN